MEVKVTKCANGHYYDVNKYDACPHCGAGKFVAKEPEKRKFGFFRRGDTTSPEKKAKSIQFSREIATHADELICEDVETVGTYSTTRMPEDDVETQGVFASPAVPDMLAKEQPLASPCTVDSDLTTGFFSSSTPAETKTPSLQEQVNAATDDNDVKTTGFFVPKKPAGDITPNIPQPPVGWLVCLTGKHIGKDYRIFAGKNSIGRTADNAIALSDETSVSREKHAWVIFEPRKQEFYLKSGDESGLVYLNDENVFDIAPLHTGDVLELGEVKMVFVELCGEKFSWNDYINKG